LDNIEEQFKDTIFLDPQHLIPDVSVSYDLNHIRQFQGIVLGRPGSGKTQVANWLAAQLCEKYGRDRVNAVWSRSIDGLLSGIRGTLVNLLVLDDLTLIKTSSNDLANLFRIRHIIQAKTGSSYGLVILLLGLHRFFGCDPSIRTNFDFLAFRSAPTNQFDRNFTKGYIRKQGVDLLSKLEMQRLKDSSLFPVTGIWLKGTGSGYINTPLQRLDYLRKVENGLGVPSQDSVRSWEEIYARFRRGYDV